MNRVENVDLGLMSSELDRVSRYCMTNHLKTVGNCRLCLVEREGLGKGIASCNDEGVWNKDRIRRGSMLEGILCNHPLDCVICDKGGECELQNVVRSSTLRRGRNVAENMKDVLRYGDNMMMIETCMSRCIECSKCIRVLKDLTGRGLLGILGRSEDVLINEYEDLCDEGDMFIGGTIGGNIIDICPVGLEL